MTDSRALTVAWLALTALTLAGWWLGHHVVGERALWPVLALTALKGRCVALRFMGLDAAPAWLRRAVLLWLFALLLFVGLNLS